ncbi:hypothetical protein [Solemya elarraichensis gill symbiont]|uniref:hypothetical protein n=1 Tax=Solemya elarraichensis gill symbiont TaxID=1918949 RepID=UPI0026855886
MLFYADAGESTAFGSRLIFPGECATSIFVNSMDAQVATSSVQPQHKYPPGDLAIWIFILAELLVFAIFFVAYAFARMNDVELFNHYQLTLDRNSALINTIALLTSSYFVVQGVIRTLRAKERESKARSPR